MTNRKLIAQQMNRAFQMMAEGLNLPEERAMEIADLYEPWATGKAYKAGKIVKYGVNADGETQLYSVLQSHTSQEDWTPNTAASLYKPMGFEPDGTPMWTQPLGATDAYMKGDRVTHNGKEWISTIDSNVWEPGVYGWENQM
ncbi:MAG: ChiA1 [Chaetfec virus UA24_244]|nr:MAG: ChiA1 [Chaetfec virus UA24_244]